MPDAVPMLRRCPLSVSDELFQTALSEIAHIVAGDDSTLREVAGIVARFQAALANAIATNKVYPTRKALDARLNALRLAITTIRECVEDHQVAPVLLRGDAFFDHQYEMLAGLEALETRTKKVCIRKGKGKDKHYARPSGLNEQGVCALMVATAWREANGVWPPHNNSSAQRACAALWASAGGEKGWADASISVWKGHLEAAKAAEVSDEALHVQALMRGPAGY